MMPAVTVFSKPNGEPMASTQSPTRAFAGSPSLTAGRPFASIFTTPTWSARATGGNRAGDGVGAPPEGEAAAGASPPGAAERGPGAAATLCGAPVAATGSFFEQPGVSKPAVSNAIRMDLRCMV